MKTHVRSIVLFLATFAVAGIYAATPPVEVTVRSTAAGGNAVQKIWTDSHGEFALNNLPAGYYRLEFRTQKTPELRNKQFTLSIVGTKQIGTQGGIAGTSLVGGVALNVEVGAHAKIYGQIATGVPNDRVAWQPAYLGSNLPGHWTKDLSVAPTYNIVRVPNDIFRKAQDEGDSSL